jgi:hypothetical protein
MSARSKDLVKYVKFLVSAGVMQRPVWLSVVERCGSLPGACSAHPALWWMAPRAAPILLAMTTCSLCSAPAACLPSSSTRKASAPQRSSSQRTGCWTRTTPSTQRWAGCGWVGVGGGAAHVAPNAQQPHSQPWAAAVRGVGGCAPTHGASPRLSATPLQAELEPVNLGSFEPPAARKFVHRQMALMQQGIERKAAYAMVEAELQEQQ